MTKFNCYTALLWGFCQYHSIQFTFLGQSCDAMWIGSLQGRRLYILTGRCGPMLHCTTSTQCVIYLHISLEHNNSIHISGTLDMGVLCMFTFHWDTRAGMRWMMCTGNLHFYWDIGALMCGYFHAILVEQRKLHCWSHTPHDIGMCQHFTVTMCDSDMYCSKHTINFSCMKLCNHKLDNFLSISLILILLCKFLLCSKY